MNAISPAELRRTCLLVLGMRSGTSALAQCLSKLGAGLPSLLLPGNFSNETGHFEPQRIVDFNDALLGELGAKWDTLRDPDLAALPTGALAQRRDTLRDLIATEYGHAPLIVLKEPRIGRLVPLYVEALEAAGYDIRVILTRRHPMAVAKSFVARDKGELGHALLLWISYALSIEASTRKLRRTFVSYDDLVVDASRALSIAMASLEIALPRAGSIEAAQATIRPDLHHQLPGVERVPAFVSDTAEALNALARHDRSPAAMTSLDRQRAFVNALLDRYEAQISSELTVARLFELCDRVALSGQLIDA